VYSDSALDAAETEESLMEAQKAYLESLSVCDELQGTISETELREMRSRLYLNLGLVYDSKNDPQSARKFIDKALHIAR
jgi:NF-kappa-B inhibitor-like protein 2